MCGHLDGFPRGFLQELNAGVPQVTLFQVGITKICSAKIHVFQVATFWKVSVLEACFAVTSAYISCNAQCHWKI
jgi:hypothetical protein